MADKLYQDKEWLEMRYWDDGLSTRQIGRLAGCDNKTVRTWMVKHGIPTRNRKKGGKDTYKDKDWLYRKYWTEELSTVEIGTLVGRCHETICLWMDRFEIPKRDPLTAYSIIFSDKQLEEAVKLYEEGWSLTRLMEKYDMSQRQLQKNLDRAGVEYRPQNRQYSINERVFDDLNSEHASYWAGFLFADGGCFNRVLQVGLAIKDRCQVERLRAFLECDNPIYVLDANGCKQIRFYCSGVRLSERLKQLGVSNNLSGIQTLRQELKEDFRCHWLRGFHDGDGSAVQNGYLAFCGKTKVLEFIREILDSVLNEDGSRPIRKHKSANASYLIYSRGWPARLVAQFMYEDASVFLDRKWKIVVQVWPETSPGSVPDCAK